MNSASTAHNRGHVWYLSGPMSGYPEHNFPAFAQAAAATRARGLTVVSPAELNPEPGHPWEWYLRRDLEAMLRDCTALALLPGWEASRGAKLEVHVAQQLGMRIRTLAELLADTEKVVA